MASLIPRLLWAWPLPSYSDQSLLFSFSHQATYPYKFCERESGLIFINIGHSQGMATNTSSTVVCPGTLAENTLNLELLDLAKYIKGCSVKLDFQINTKQYYNTNMMQCLGHTYTKKSFAVCLKFKFSWA